jgi:formylglycine-generating enzyme required for sulfatase activity
MSLLLVACGSDKKKEVVDIGITPGTKTITMGQQTTFAVATTNTDYSVSTDKAAAGCVKTNATTVTCTPTAADTYTLTVTATADKNKTKTATLVVNNVVDNDVVITVLPATTTTTVGQATSPFTVTVTPLTNTDFNFPDLPNGITCAKTGNNFTCTPTIIPVGGTFEITVAAQADASKTKQVTITVNPVAFTVNVSSAEVEVNGDPAVFEFSTAFTFEADAKTGCAYHADDSKKLVCAPTVLGDYTVTVTATAPADPQSLEVSIAAAPEVIAGMVLVETGYVQGAETPTFRMGCTVGETLGENPTWTSSTCAAVTRDAHDVTLTKDYYIGQTEVTQAQWKEVMGEESNLSVNQGNDLPVTDILWAEIQTFIDKLNEVEITAGSGKVWRLPTEAEWEFAARGGVSSLGYRYSGGNDTAFFNNDIAWYISNSDNKTHPVKSKLPNELGIYDMSGNVAEYVADWYSTKYSSEAVADPSGPASHVRDYRVVRGGSWQGAANSLMVVSRGYNDGASRLATHGFRLALTITEPSAPTATAEPTFFESASATVSSLWDSITK